MKKPDFGNFTSFNDAQIATATATFSAAASRVRSNTLDDDFSDRLGHEIILLGTRSILSNCNEKLEPMTVSRLKKLVISEFGVTSQAIDADLKKLKEEGIITVEKGVLDDGRESLISLTEVGTVLYRLLGERIACLILATADLLKSGGAVPTDPREVVKDSIKDYAAPIRRYQNKSNKED